jgi:hypothetical protein
MRLLENKLKKKTKEYHRKKLLDLLLKTIGAVLGLDEPNEDQIRIKNDLNCRNEFIKILKAEDFKKYKKHNGHDSIKRQQYIIKNPHKFKRISHNFELLKEYHANNELANLWEIHGRYHIGDLN